MDYDLQFHMSTAQESYNFDSPSQNRTVGNLKGTITPAIANWTAIGDYKIKHCPSDSH